MNASSQDAITSVTTIPELNALAIGMADAKVDICSLALLTMLVRSDAGSDLPVTHLCYHSIGASGFLWVGQNDRRYALLDSSTERDQQRYDPENARTTLFECASALKKTGENVSHHMPHFNKQFSRSLVYQQRYISRLVAIVEVPESSYV